MRIPSKNECMTLIFQMGTLEHIVSHSVQVCRVALFLTDRINSFEPLLNRKLVRASALLHDITKTRSFDTGENHAQTGGELLREMDYPEVADIVSQHVCLKNYDMGDRLGEAEIVNYADKRVLHDRIVSFADRMDYIRQRYGKLPEHRDKIQWLWRKSRELEEKIFAPLPFSPDDLTTMIEEDMTPELFANVDNQLKDNARAWPFSMPNRPRLMSKGKKE